MKITAGCSSNEEEPSSTTLAIEQKQCEEEDVHDGIIDAASLRGEKIIICEGRNSV